MHGQCSRHRNGDVNKLSLDLFKTFLGDIQSIVNCLQKMFFQPVHFIWGLNAGDFCIISITKANIIKPFGCKHKGGTQQAMDIKVIDLKDGKTFPDAHEIDGSDR